MSEHDAALETAAPDSGQQETPALPSPRATVATTAANPEGEPEVEVDRPRAGWPTVPDRRQGALHAVTTAAAELRFVHEQPASLKQSLALARQGAWTTTRTGPLRRAAVVHVWCIQVPVLVIGALIAWAARTPGRLWTVALLVLTVATALDQIPVVRLFVPEFLTWPYWPPFCWFN